MKKLLFCSLPLAILIIGCVGSNSGNNSINKKEITENVANEKALKSFFDGFIKKNPNYLNNAITKEEAAKLLASEFTTLASADSLACISDLPAKLEMMLPYSNGEEYVVKFVCLSHDNEVSNEYTVSYQVFSKMPREEATIIKEGVEYSITGRFVGFLTPGNFTLPSGRGATDLPTIYSFDGKPNFNLGTLVVEGLKLTEASE